MTVALRPRRPDDLPVLLALLQRTHETEGYPVRAEAVSAEWLASEDELGGWVAVQDERVLGHVALHPVGDDDAARPGWEAGAGLPAARLAVVSRLFTDGSAPGAGSALLAHATGQARALGRRAVLQVDPVGRAGEFYRRRGWSEVGVARQQWGHRTVDAVLMVQGDPRAAEPAPPVRVPTTWTATTWTATTWTATT